MAFVGRERELARLAAGLERAARGDGARLALVGPAGIGVTRLLTELEARLAGLPDVVVARGTAYAPLSGTPYAALGEALAAALASVSDARLAEVLGPWRHDLLLLVPGLATRLEALGVPDEVPWTISADQRAVRVAEAVLGVLERIADRGVVLLALEDLHWADPGTRRFVETILRARRRLPLCLVLTFRPEELHLRHPMRDLANALETDPEVERLALPPMEHHQLVKLLEALLGERPSGAFVAAVAGGSGGVPLLAEELVAAQRAAAGIRLSDPFEEILGARLATLSVGAVRCLRLLAAARRPLPLALVRRVELRGGGLPATAVDEALESGLAVAQPGPDGHGLVGIRHERYAEAIEELSLPTERQPIHEALARALAGRPAEQAWHWEAAMRFSAARDAHLAAGTLAAAVDPGGTTLLHEQRALELMDAHEGRPPSTTIAPADLLARAAEAAFADDNPRRAAGLMQQALDERSNPSAVGRAASGGPVARERLQRELGLLQLRLGQFRGAGGDVLAALDAFESAVQLLPSAPSAERARALAMLAQHLMLEGRFEESARRAEQARDLARQVGDEALPELGHATCTLAVDRGYAGSVADALALLDEAASVAERTHRLDDLMRATVNRTHLLMSVDAQFDAALAAAEAGIAAARKLGAEAVYGSLMRASAADILHWLGRWHEVELEARTALEWSPGRVAWSPLLVLGSVLVESRADEEASRTVGQILLQLESVPEGQWTAAVQRTAVSFALWRDDLADADRVARRGWLRVGETDDWRQAALAASTTLEVCAAVADAGRARRDVSAVAAAGEFGTGVVAQAERLVAAAEMPPPVGARRQAELHVATARAHLGRLRGRPDAQEWARIAEAWSDFHAPYLAAKARWWQAAAALHAGGQRAVARTALAEAWELAALLPARPLLRELARLAQRARIVLPALPEALAIEVAAGTLPGRREPVAVGPGRPLGTGSPSDWSVLPPGGAARELDAVSSAVAIQTAAAAIGHPEFSARLVPPAAPPVADPFNLSPREYEVLAIVAEGRTNREVAERLFISERTVGVHVRNILGKLGVSGRVEAASVAIRLGLVPGVPRGVHGG
ncbi:MAG: helix-turn-helix transcriptional regulator [Candidatus Limnocylindrales bacterium]